MSNKTEQEKKVDTAQLLNYLKRVHALAETGQHFADSDYDMDRYTELERLSIEMIGMITGNDVRTLPVHISEKYGYRTPKVDVRAVIFNEQDEILMVREQIDDRWSLPGGWADVGFSPAEIAVKETFEEAGMNVSPLRLLGVFDKRCHNHPPDVYYAYKIFVECKANNNRIETGYETTDAGFFSLENLPELSTPRNTRRQVELMFEYRNAQLSWPHLDIDCS